MGFSLILVCGARSEDSETLLPKSSANEPTNQTEVTNQTIAPGGAETLQSPEESAIDFPPDEIFLSEPPPDDELSREQEPEKVKKKTEVQSTAESEEEMATETTEQEQEAPEEEPEVVYELAPVIQRTAIHQALGTGETILANVGGLQGVVISPFLTRELPPVLPLRAGPVRLRPVISAGVSVGQSTGNENGGDWVSGLFGGGLQALYSGGLSSATLSYNFGVAFPEAPRVGNGSSSGSSGGGPSFDQQLILGADLVFPEMKRLKFGLGLAFTGLSGVDRDVGADSQREIATLSLTASYDYSRKTSCHWSISLPVRKFNGGVSSSGLTSTISISNQISRKTRIGIGYSLGSLAVDTGENQFFQQLLLNANSTPTIFISFDSTLGLEYRVAGGSSSVSPIFGLGATWNSQHGTAVSLAADSRIFNAASDVDTNYTSTSFVLSLNQRLVYRLTGSLSLAYEYAEYESVGTATGTDGGAGGEAGRVDHLLSASLGLALPITPRWNCSLSSQWGKNRSNTDPFSFSQITFQMSYAF